MRLWHFSRLHNIDRLASYEAFIVLKVFEALKIIFHVVPRTVALQSATVLGTTEGRLIGEFNTLYLNMAIHMNTLHKKSTQDTQKQMPLILTSTIGVSAELRLSMTIWYIRG